MKGKSGSPITRARFRRLVSNGAVHTARPGLPSCSKEMLSCKLHEEQLPQSPAAVIRKSERSAIECNISGSAVRLESSLLSIGNASQ